MRISIYITVFLYSIWITLHEGYSLPILISGVVLSAFCVGFYRRSIERAAGSGYSVRRLVPFLLYLPIEAYISAVKAIKLIFQNVSGEFVELKTSLKSPFLRVVLTNSITFTPGSIALDLKGDTISVLWLRKKIDGEHTICRENADTILKGKLEKLLFKAERPARGKERS